MSALCIMHVLCVRLGRISEQFKMWLLSGKWVLKENDHLLVVPSHVFLPVEYIERT